MLFNIITQFRVTVSLTVSNLFPFQFHMCQTDSLHEAETPLFVLQSHVKIAIIVFVT